MRYLLLFMFLVAIFVLGSRFSMCKFAFGGTRGEGPIKTETRNVSGFHGVDLALSGDVTVRTGADYSVAVHAQENLLPLLKTEVNNGILEIYFDGNVSYSEDLKIEISAPNLDEFLVSGSGKMEVQTPLQAETIHMTVSGSGDIVANNISSSRVTGAISGSGALELGGRTGSMSMDISGSGDLKGKQLTCDSLNVQIAGSGSAHARVERALTGSVAGSGDVFYDGNPSVNVDVAGSGSVKKDGGQ